MHGPLNVKNLHNYVRSCEMSITANHEYAIPLAYRYEDVSLITSRFKMTETIQIICIKLHETRELSNFLQNISLFGILRHK